MEGIKKALICSIGPTTTETLRENGVSVDYEPDSPKMGNLVREVARRSAALLAKKENSFSKRGGYPELEPYADGLVGRRRPATKERNHIFGGVYEGVSA